MCQCRGEVVLTVPGGCTHLVSAYSGRPATMPLASRLPMQPRSRASDDRVHVTKKGLSQGGHKGVRQLCVQQRKPAGLGAGLGAPGGVREGHRRRRVPVQVGQQRVEAGKDVTVVHSDGLHRHARHRCVLLPGAMLLSEQGSQQEAFTRTRSRRRREAGVGPQPRCACDSAGAAPPRVPPHERDCGCGPLWRDATVASQRPNDRV